MNKLIIGAKYRHFNGYEVTVLDIATHTETSEKMVVYGHNKEMWVSPMSKFMSKVDKEKYPNVSQENCFELIEEA